jgi:asparagine synthase (glutamine-hydrolysing)
VGRESGLSDIFIAAGPRWDASAIAKLLSWTPQTKAWSQSNSDLTWVVTRVDSPGLWAPARDPQSGLRALLGGRIAPEEAEWKAAEALPYEGGLACRLVLDRWLTGGAKAIEALNGGAQIIVIDERERALHVWTDRMGFYPAFVWTGVGFLLCSHPDVLAEALETAGHPLKFDVVTMAEFLRTGTATHPHTYWRSIRHMDAATHFEFELGASPRLRTSTVYWQPAYLRGEPYLRNRAEIVDKLATALTSAVRRRTQPRLGKIGVLLSAGADSRTALFGACEPSAVTCFTFYDEINQEFRGAKMLAQVAQAKHVGIQRSKEYYYEGAAEAVRVSGGMWSIESAHHTGIRSAVLAEGIDTLLTGCYADYLLKGITYDTTNIQLLGRDLPLHRFAPFDFEWHHAHRRLASEWDGLVEVRLRDRFQALALDTERSRSELEHARLSQIVREPDASGRLFLRKTLPVDFFMSDNDIVDLFGRICPSEKLNAIPFGMAVARITGRQGDRVLNNNFSAPVGAQELQRVLIFLLNSIRRKFDREAGRQPFERDPASIATVGSWPNFPRAMRMSAVMRKWLAHLPLDQLEFFGSLAGDHIRNWTLEDWADRNPTLLARLYTASLWLSQNNRALTRIETSPLPSP